MIASHILPRPRVRAVVLNYGPPDTTVACVRSLLRQTWQPLDIVVVDNYSSEANATALRNSLPTGVHLVLSPTNRGYAAGNNVGCRAGVAATPAYVLVVNGDALLPLPSDLERMMGGFEEDDRIVAISPLVHTRSNAAPANEQIQVRRDAGFLTCLIAGSWWLRRVPGLRNYYRAHVYEDVRPYARDRIYLSDSINGSCFLIRFDFLRSIGFLDEGTFLYFEEIILGRQVRLRGLRCALVTSVCVEHHQGLSTQQRGTKFRWRMHRHAVNSQVHYCRKYLGVGVPGLTLLVGVRTLDYASRSILAGVAAALSRAAALCVAAAHSLRRGTRS